MVSIRNVHFEKAHTLFDEWLKILPLSEKEQIEIHKIYEYCYTFLYNDNFQYHLQNAKEKIEILIPLNMDIETLLVTFLSSFPNTHQIEEQIKTDFSTSFYVLFKSFLTMNSMGLIRNYHHLSSKNIENVRKMLLAMIDDVRAVVIKLAEVVIKLRNLKNDPEEEKVLYSKEVIDIYAPLANRLGIGQIKWELEDLSFRYLHPHMYKKIASHLDEKRLDRENYVNHLVDILEKMLTKENINVKVYGRPKHIYSIWKKMKRKNIPFDALYDVRAIRIITDKLQDCYFALGIVHTHWQHLKEEFDDYIAVPKNNGYQSIHTVILGPDKKTVEIQIRTEQMHNDAELGVAAHWKYKEGVVNNKNKSFENKINWLRKILAWQDDILESTPLVDEVHSQAFEDRVYVFTPQGEIIDLPNGSTVLDFAYYIHSQIGHRAIGAKIDNVIVPFTTQVKTGQKITILTSNTANPKKDWLNPKYGFIYTSRAKLKIQTFFKQKHKEKYIQDGKILLNNALQKANISNVEIKDILQKYSINTPDELYIKIATQIIKVNQIIRHFNHNVIDDNKLIDNILQQTSTKKTSKQSDIEVYGVGNLLHHIANCCNPIVGDTIYGYITQGKGISIHRQNCEQLLHLIKEHPERGIEVNWGNNYKGAFTVKLHIFAEHNQTLLRDITSLLANEKIDVLEITNHFNKKQLENKITLILSLFNINEIELIVRKIYQIKGIHKVHRT